MQQIHKLIGLIGYPLEHSFSERYFNQKFRRLNWDFIEYKNFPLEEIEDLPMMLDLFPEICAFNVTSPYKQSVMKYLSEVDEPVRQIGAVNTVLVFREDDVWWLKGFNTDVYGFEKVIKRHLQPQDRRALILGTGGAALAVAYVFEHLGIDYAFVSRSERDWPGRVVYIYEHLTKAILDSYQIIVNATPLGMYPNVSLYPPFPYRYVNSQHLMFDLIYNPQMTKFLEFGKERGARTVNGLQMLYAQADKSWEIFAQHGCFGHRLYE